MTCPPSVLSCICNANALHRICPSSFFHASVLSTRQYTYCIYGWELQCSIKLVVHALEIKQLTLYSTLSTTVTCFGLRVIDLVPTCYYLTSPLFARIALVLIFSTFPFFVFLFSIFWLPSRLFLSFSSLSYLIFFFFFPITFTYPFFVLIYFIFYNFFTFLPSLLLFNFYLLLQLSHFNLFLCFHLFFLLFFLHLFLLLNFSFLFSCSFF